ncbi:MAG: hypothetical protein PUE66_06590 [Erysipelotrichaceae bacterium]|nr:hypothetical protein [Erysipelotrichaceae bacterium]
MCFDCEPVAINMSTIFAQTFVLCQPSLHGTRGDDLRFIAQEINQCSLEKILKSI